MQVLLELELGFTPIQMPSRVGWKNKQTKSPSMCFLQTPILTAGRNKVIPSVPHVPFPTLSLICGWVWVCFLKPKQFFHHHERPPYQETTLTRDRLRKKPPSQEKDYPYVRPLKQEITFMTDHSPKRLRSPSWQTTLLRDWDHLHDTWQTTLLRDWDHLHDRPLFWETKITFMTDHSPERVRSPSWQTTLLRDYLETTITRPA